MLGKKICGVMMLSMALASGNALKDDKVQPIQSLKGVAAPKVSNNKMTNSIYDTPTLQAVSTSKI